MNTLYYEDETRHCKSKEKHMARLVGSVICCGSGPINAAMKS